MGAVAPSRSPDQEEHFGPLFLLNLDVKKSLGQSFLCSAWKPVGSESVYSQCLIAWCPGWGKCKKNPKE